MPIQKRPLVTAARFPGIFQHGTNQGLAQGITSAFGNVSNAMIQNKIMEASAAKEASIRATEEQARTFQFIAGLGDGKNVMEDDGKKRAMLRQLAREAGNSGQDMTPYMDALAIDAPDELNLHLARVATQLGAKPIKGVAIGENQRLANPYTGATMGPEPTAEPADLTAVQEDLIAAGFTPGTKEFQDKLLELISRPIAPTVNIDNRDFKTPPNYKPNPDEGKVSEQYPQGDPREVVPIKGGPEDTVKPVSAEAAKVGEISRAGLDAANKLKAMLKKGDITQDTLLAAAAPDFLNVFKSANVQEFQIYRNDLVDMIGRMRSGGAINKDEEATFLSMLPIHGDGDDIMDIKINRLAEMFESIGNRVDPSQKPDMGLTPKIEKERTITNSDGTTTNYQKIDGEWYVID